LFAKGQKQGRFLSYVVEKALTGGEAALREYEIGLDVYGRGHLYDPKSDPIVRVEASRLRSKLREYYSTAGAGEPFRIELPKGRYVPQFVSASELQTAITGEQPPPVAPPALFPVAPDPVATPALGRLSRWPWWVAFLVVAAAGTYFAWTYFADRAVTTEVKSIAVLPIQDQTGQRQQIADGLTDQLIEELGRVSGLHLVGRSSVYQFRDRKDDPREIGRRLRVDAVVDGTLRASGDRLRLTASLIDVRTGFVLWSGRFDRELSDLFVLEDELSYAIGRSLGAQLKQDRVANPEARRKAMDLFQKGKVLHIQGDGQSLVQARKLHEAAVQADPSWPLGHSGLSHVYTTIISYGYASRDELRDKALAEARKSLEMDPQLGDGFSALLRVYRDVDLNLTQAETTCQEAGSNVPNAYSVRMNCGILYSILGRHDKALAQLAIARRWDPVFAGARDQMALTLLRAGRLEEAEKEARELLAESPSFVSGYSTRGLVLLAMNRRADAITAFERGKDQDRSGGGYWLAYLGYLYGSDNAARAREFLRRVETNRGDSVNTSRAWVLAGLGEKEKSFTALEAAADKREPFLLDTLTGLCWPELKKDPRYAKLRVRLGLQN
jgi:TolB-like protein/Tfp pilus assembly protein PilF